MAGIATIVFRSLGTLQLLLKIRSRKLKIVLVFFSLICTFASEEIKKYRYETDYSDCSDFSTDSNSVYGGGLDGTT